MTNEVVQALAKMATRRNNRSYDLDSQSSTRQEDIDALRAEMFTRCGPAEKFHPLSTHELALLESEMNRYVLNRKLRAVLCGIAHREDYDLLRRNHLSGEKTVPASSFRGAAHRIIQRLMTIASNDGKIPRGTVAVLPWRAGLAFAHAAKIANIRDFYHLGARRDEERKLETLIYFDEAPSKSEGGNASRPAAGVVTDPMLATGNTAIVGIERLKRLGIPEEKITVIAVISAPEGVDHILNKFPGVTIYAGNHDERLNDRGYIEPGLGDFGDLYFDGLGEEDVEKWRIAGVLSRNAARVLMARMTNVISA